MNGKGRGEDSSDAYRLTGSAKKGKTAPKKEPGGGADLRWEPPPRQNHEARERVLDQIKLELAQFLESLAPWDWFATYTFSSLVSAAAAHAWFRRHARFLQKKARQPIYAFRADEYGPNRGSLHMHALIGNVAHLTAFCGERLPPGKWGRPCCGVHSWPCGSARVRVYDPKIGATGYVTKYTTKDFGDYEFIGFPAVPQLVLE